MINVPFDWHGDRLEIDRMEVNLLKENVDMPMAVFSIINISATVNEIQQMQIPYSWNPTDSKKV